MTTINHSARVGVITDQTGALTRQVQAGLAGGVAALCPGLPQKTA